MGIKRNKQVGTKKQSLIFLHIPKAAGTTLHSIIERQYNAKEIYSINGLRVDESIEKYKSLPQEERNKIKILKGHMYFGLHKFMHQPSTYITILRDPVERVISHYHYVQRNPTHYLYHKVKSENMTLTEFVEAKLSVELNNGQTRLISGIKHGVPFGECSSEMLTLAQKNLKEYFSVVGFTDRYDETLILLRKTLGWKTPYYMKRNVTSNRKRNKDVCQSTIETIKKYNELDVELYHYAKESFARAIALQSSSFNVELAKFRTFNKQYGKICSLFQIFLNFCHRLVH